MKQRSLMAGLAVVVASLAASPARAENATIATALDAVIGEERSDFLDADGTVNSLGHFKYTLAAQRSYRIFCWQPNVEGGGACEAFILDSVGTFVSTDSQTEPVIAGNGLRKSAYFRPATSGTYYGLIDNDGPAATTQMVLIETTLFSPWYFVSPSSGYDGFIEIRNNTTASQTVTVYVYRDTGTLAGSTSVTIAANGNTLVAASTLNPGGSGSVGISHTAMPGGISANITTLSATTGLSFDSPFTPREQWNTF
jgi:hypothetical protein